MTALGQFGLHVDDALLERGVAVGFILLSGIDNRAIDPAFHALRRTHFANIVSQSTFADVCADPAITAYRDLHAELDLDDPPLVPSPESLFAVLHRHGDLRPINALVDVYNLVALSRRLSCGAHDLDTLEGGVRLSLTDGSETFTPLGARKPQAVPAGDYAYIDGANRIVCRRECRQAAHSAVTEQTRDALIIVQGNRAVTTAAIEQAGAEIVELIERYVSPAASVRYELVARADRPRRRAGGGA